MPQDLITLESTVVASQDQVSADLANEVVILSLKNGEYYGLKAVGMEIWSLIQAPSSVAAVCDSLLKEYPDVDPEQCRGDVLAVLEDLCEAGLVEVVLPQGA